MESLGTERQREYLKIFVPICVSILIISSVLSTTLNVIYNAHDDVNKTLVSLGMTSAYFVVLLYYFYALINYGEISEFLVEVQNIVSIDCKWEDAEYLLSKIKYSFCWAANDSIEREMLYKKAHQRIGYVMQILEWAFNVSSIMYALSFLNVALCLCMGNYTHQSWVFFFGFW